jgi:hypothetical protein
MGKILVTGNGFDLFHGLPTKYGHFMAVMEAVEKLDSKISISFQDLFGNGFGSTFPKDYELLGEKFDYQRINFDARKINELKKLIKDNLWYKHFKTVLEIETWIDFETELQFILSHIVVFFNHANEIGVDKEFGRYVDWESLVFFGILEIDSDGHIWINKSCVSRGRLNVKNVLENLVTSLEHFIVIFNRYLINIVGAFYDRRLNKYSIPYYRLDKIYTFNYTSTLESIYGIDPSKIVYLHGKTNKDDELQNLVLGVSEIPKEIKASKMFDFTKYYQKVRKNLNHKFIKIPNEKTHQRNEEIFYIIGHSLDESDKEYVADLFKFLEFDLSKKSKICVFFHNSYDYENKLKNLFSIINKEVIEEICKDKRLYFVELTQDNIAQEFDKNIYNHAPIKISMGR